MSPHALWPLQAWGNPDLPPLVMLHGFLGRGTDWSEIAQQLSDTHHVICPDLPGHGENPLAAPTTFEAMADGLLSTISNAAIEQFDLLGYSMGGRLALYVAARFPERMNRLVIESASPGIEDEPTRLSRCHHDDALAAELEAIDSAEALEDWLRQWYAEPLWSSLHARPGLVEALVHARRDAVPKSLGAALRSFSTGRQPSLWDDLPGLPCRLFLMVGELDHKYTKISERMVECNPGIARMIFADCGHNVHIEATESYTTALKSFLAG